MKTLYQEAVQALEQMKKEISNIETRYVPQLEQCVSPSLFIFESTYKLPMSLNPLYTFGIVY